MSILELLYELKTYVNYLHKNFIFANWLFP